MMNTFDTLSAAEHYAEKHATVCKLRYRWRAWLRDPIYGDRKEYGETRQQALANLASTLPITNYET